jgi:hypothetical protein
MAGDLNPSKVNTMRCRTWRNVSGTFVTEIPVQTDDEFAELEIDFVSSGHYDPGSRYGGPHDLGYPPEGEDEREFTTARLNGVPLPDSQGREYFSQFKEKIDEVELDFD